MSASETGDEVPLVQFFSSVRNSASARAPASRTVSLSKAASRFMSCAKFPCCTPSALASAKRQSLDAHRRRIDAIAEFQIVGRHHRLEDLEQMTGDGDLADRIADLAILDPEAGSTAAIVA